MLKEKNIPIFNMVFPIISIFLLSSLITYFFVNNQYENFEKESILMEREYIKEQKEFLEQKVNKVISDSKEIKENLEIQERIRLKKRVNLVHRMFNYLYLENKNNPDIEKILHDCIFPLRWNNQRGYYFVLDLDGKMFSHPINPKLENKSSLELKDSDGNFPVKKFLDIAKRAKEGYTTYKWTKPIDKNFSYKKESYVKLFEPLGLVIGTGEYLDIIKESAQTKILRHISKVNAMNKEQYIFVLDKKGNIILHPYITNTNNVLEVKDKTGKYFIKELIEKSINFGGFTEYHWRDLTGNKEVKKISFAKEFSSWDWVIGTGIYMDSIYKQIEQKKLDLETNIDKEIKSIVSVSLIVFIIVSILSIIFSRTINIIFKKYKKQVNEREESLKELNQNLEDRVREEIKAKVEKEKKIIRQTTDLLTNLPNREKLSQDIEALTHPKLAILNIDRFKEINDYYGHDIGDEVIKKSSEMIDLKLDKSNQKLYRIVGDEFAILTNEETSINDFVKLLEGIMLDINTNHFTVFDNEFSLDITVGIAIEKKNIYIHAEMAMKNARESNEKIGSFDGKVDIQKKYEQNITWTKKLKDAIREDRIILFAQPIFDNKTLEAKKYECLIRLIDDDGSIVSPFFFLEIAKKARQYENLTKIVLEKALKHFEKKDVEFSINLTIDDLLNRKTFNFIRNKLENYSNAKNLILEIVESEGIENFEEVSEKIAEFKKIGCKIAIDDFGTGYSNFEYLMKLNVDFIKIDGSLIKNITESSNSELVVKLIIDFAKELNIKTIAEFVHSQEVLEKIQEMGIDCSQGFHLGKPEAI